MALASKESQPKSVYIHIPFCRHRCGYCNFTLVAKKDDLIDRYLDCLEREIATLENRVQIETAFFGGGTPTHLDPRQLARLFKIFDQWFDRSETVEISMEANPIDIDVQKANLLSQLGVNRLSLGIQSFDDAKLKRLERDHDAKSASNSIQIARDHFDSVSLDLIFGVGDEKISGWENDLRIAVKCAPNHISTYGLTIEKGTTFWNRQLRGELMEVSEDVGAEMYSLAIDYLTSTDNNFEHYEVSNFAKIGNRNYRCHHNEIYWSCENYYAFGAGAARFIAKGR